MGKIAVKFRPLAGIANGGSAQVPRRQTLARGDRWSVSDLLCTAGPRDRPFEEQHTDVCIAMVMEGSFQCGSSTGREMLTPGSLLLGNAGQYFECGHEHGVGDRCVSFSYQRGYFEDLADEACVRGRSRGFSLLRVPPVRELSSLVARTCAGLAKYSGPIGDSAAILATPEWEEIGIELATRALEIAGSGEPNRRSSLAAEARVTRIVRMIESCPDASHELNSLAREARLSRYHFLRVFRQLTGVSPHQYIMRTRLRSAAMRLMGEPARVLDIALQSGFGDVSNFNHAFRAEFGASPRSYRNGAHRRPPGS